MKGKNLMLKEQDAGISELVMIFKNWGNKAFFLKEEDYDNFLYADYVKNRRKILDLIFEIRAANKTGGSFRELIEEYNISKDSSAVFLIMNMLVILDMESRYRKDEGTI